MWQITQGYNTNTESLPAPPLVPTTGFKEKQRKAPKRTVRWEWKQFGNSARADGLQLWHWVKARVL